MDVTATTGGSGAGAGWDPDQYRRFADERERPFHDLLSRVAVTAARSVVDLGCGTGGLTAGLLRRWPGARVVGVDSSEAMLREAATHAQAGRLEFVLGDVRDFVPAGPVDVVVSNATLHWVPGHLDLLARLYPWIAPGGAMALQVPGNFDEPTHVLLRDLASSSRWAPLLDGRIGPWPYSHDALTYLVAMQTAGLHPTAWETTYMQVLRGPDAVLEWMSGTALRPVLAALEAPEREAFVAEYRAALRGAYPERPEGTVLPFRRVFAVGHRDGDQVRP